MNATQQSPDGCAGSNITPRWFQNSGAICTPLFWCTRRTVAVECFVFWSIPTYCEILGEPAFLVVFFSHILTICFKRDHKFIQHVAGAVSPN